MESTPLMSERQRVMLVTYGGAQIREVGRCAGGLPKSRGGVQIEGYLKSSEDNAW
jgi:hypothetical protein